MLLSTVIFFFATAAAAPMGAVRHIEFNNGEASVHDQIKGRQFMDYKFSVGAGQRFRASLKTNNSANYFNLLGPGQADMAFFNGEMNDNSYAGQALASGEHTARVYLMRSAARRGEKASYKLTITLIDMR